MLFILLISYLSMATSANVKLLPDEKNNEASYLATCVHEIYHLHQNFYKLTIVIYANKTKENIPNYIFTKTNSFVTTNDINKLNQTSGIHEGTVLIVIYLKSSNELTDLEVIIFDIKFRYIVIVDTYLKAKCFEVAKTKLSALNNYDVIFITTDVKTGEYNLITAIPEIDAITCNITEIVKINVVNICKNGLLNKKKVTDTFPAKEPTNLKMCNFNVGMATLYPYAKVNNESSLKNLDTTGNLIGADVEIMKIVANKLNSTLKLFYVFRDKQNPYIFQQLVQYLSNGTIDVCAGGLYRIYGDNVSYSGIYSRQTIFWVYTVERERRSWQSLVSKMTGLYIFLITYICYVFLWNLINQFDYQTISIIDTLVYGWGALVGATGLQDARSLKQKILNIMFLIMSLHLSAYVSTQIYYYLTIEGPPQYFKTTDELRSSNKIPYLIPSSKYFVDDKKHTAYVNKSRYCNNFIDCEELMLKNNASTILIEGLLPRLQSSSAVNDEATVLRVPEDIIVTYHEMIIRKNSPLEKTFKKSIQSLFEAGICQKKYDEAIGITVVDKAKIANKNILSNSYSCTLVCKITLSQLGVAFYILVFGSCFSFCIFIFEILIKAPNSITIFNDR